MSRTILSRGAALAAATMLALTACGGTEEAPEDDAGGGVEAAEEDADQADGEDADADEDADDAAAEDGADADAADDTDAEEDSDAEDAEGDDGEGATDEDAAEAGSEGTVVEIGAEFTDEETGDVITIVSAVRDNPTEFYAATDNPDGEMVYLEVSVVPGDQFGGTISPSSFFLDDDGREVNYAASADDELEAAGYTYFDSPSRRDGEFTGYVPVYVETTADTLSGAYIRPEAEILGQDTTIPEFRGDFEVPAA